MKNTPLIITAAITGAELDKNKTKYLPITENEQIEEALKCFESGASIIHLHVRNEKGEPSQDPNRFRKVIEGIRKHSSGIIQISTGGSVHDSFEDRLAPLFLKGKAKPEMASLNMGSINFGDSVFTNLPHQIEEFLEVMHEHKIKPEFEIYDTGMLEYALNLQSSKKISDRPHFQFVMGTPYGIGASAENLAFLVQKLPLGATWTVAGIGRHQLPMMTLALAMGGHVRVGFEDNVYYRKGELAKSNAEFVERAVRFAKELDRPLATPEEVRGILSL